MKFIFKIGMMVIPIFLVGMLVYAYMQVSASIRPSYSSFSKASLGLASIVGYAGAGHMRANMQVFNSDNLEEQKAGFLFLKKEYEETGSVYSAGKLGWAYQRGLGVEPDHKKAIELYEMAAKKGMTYWQFLLAHAHEQGYLGFTPNKEEATYWLEMEPKIHIAKYECWVVSYYELGIFPMDKEKLNFYNSECSKP